MKLRPPGIVAVIERGETVLAIQRSPLVEAPGFWCFPGGSIEAGETESQAIKRELREELGISACQVREELWRSLTSWGVPLSWWRVEIPSEIVFIPDPREISDVRWLTWRQFAEISPLLESNREFLAIRSRRTP